MKIINEELRKEIEDRINVMRDETLTDLAYGFLNVIMKNGRSELFKMVSEIDHHSIGHIMDDCHNLPSALKNNDLENIRIELVPPMYRLITNYDTQYYKELYLRLRKLFETHNIYTWFSTMVTEGSLCNNNHTSRISVERLIQKQIELLSINGIYNA